MKYLELTFSGFSYLYDTYHRWKFQKNLWDRADTIQKICLIWHGITSLKTWILQIQTNAEKIKLIGCLSETKFWNLEKEHFEKKSPKNEKEYLYISWLLSTMSLLKEELILSFKGVWANHETRKVNDKR